MNTDAQKRFLIRFCYAAVILAIAVFLCRKALPVLAPFVVALLVSLLLKPIVRFLHGRCRVHKGVAAAVTVVLFYCLLGLALTLLFVKLFASAKAFVLDLPRLYNTVVEPLLETVSAELERFIARLDPAALSSISGLLESAGASLEQAVLNFSGRALTTLGGYAISVPGWLLNTLIMIIATVFITADYPLLKGFVLGQLSAPQRQRAHEIRVHLGKTLGRYVRSYALILLITFCELSAGLLLLGVDAAVLIALLIALFDILPVVGSGTVLIPWAIITAILGNYRLAARAAAAIRGDRHRAQRHRTEDRRPAGGAAPHRHAAVDGRGHLCVRAHRPARAAGGAGHRREHERRGRDPAVPPRGSAQTGGRRRCAGRRGTAAAAKAA